MNVREQIEQTSESISDIFDSIYAVKGEKLAELGSMLLCLKQTQFLLHRYDEYLRHTDSQEKAVAMFETTRFLIDRMTEKASFAAINASGVKIKELEDIIPQLDDVMDRLASVNRAIND